MTDALTPSRPDLSALITGERLAWSALGLTAEAFLALCAEEGVSGLVHRSLERDAAAHAARAVPPEVTAALAEAWHADTARELLRARETTRVLDALAAADVRPILMKGTALAYGWYAAPALRPRSDTDALVARHDVEPTRRVMAQLGYRPSLACDGELLFRQFEMAREDEFGICHAFDFHWNVSMQSAFADLLTYDELRGAAGSVPALGANARAAGPIHALLLACVHPVMHHGNEQRLIWAYDVHLLASGLSPDQWTHFGNLARGKRVGQVSARGLAAARARFGTAVPGAVLDALAAASPHEPSAEYLEPGRRWADELASNLRGLARPSDRWRLLREILLPPPAYMLRSYGLAPGGPGLLLLPALYMHRVVAGGLKLVRGQK